MGQVDRAHSPAAELALDVEAIGQHVDASGLGTYGTGSPVAQRSYGVGTRWQGEQVADGRPLTVDR